MTHATKPTYLAALRERVLLYDGAMGTSIDTFNLSAEDYGGERTNGNRDYLAIGAARRDRADPRLVYGGGLRCAEANTFRARACAWRSGAWPGVPPS